MLYPLSYAGAGGDARSAVSLVDCGAISRAAAGGYTQPLALAQAWMFFSAALT